MEEILRDLHLEKKNEVGELLIHLQENISAINAQIDGMESQQHVSLNQKSRRERKVRQNVHNTYFALVFESLGSIIIVSYFYAEI